MAYGPWGEPRIVETWSSGKLKTAKNTASGETTPVHTATSSTFLWLAGYPQMARSAWLLRSNKADLVEEFLPMSRFQRARVLGLLAVVGCILFLAGCGASVGGKSQTQTPPPNYDQQQYIAAYQQAIQGFRNNGGNVQALMFHVLTPSDQNYNDFLTNILPNVSGVSVEMPWSQIETSQGVYDFSGFDANLQPFEGSQVNLIVWPVTEGGNNDPNSGGSTPAYVFSQAWATTVGASNPQDMVVCKAYTGDSGNPFYNSAVSGGGGLWDVQSNV